MAVLSTVIIGTVLVNDSLGNGCNIHKQVNPHRRIYHYGFRIEVLHHLLALASLSWGFSSFAVAVDL